MKTGRVDVLPEAVREIEAAFEWYLERSPRTAEAFLREVERAIILVASASQVWPVFDAGTRRYRQYPVQLYSLSSHFLA